MNQRFLTASLFLILAMASAFVWGTSSSLPPIVASHFGVLGTADRFMPRTSYVILMIVLQLVMTLFFSLLPYALMRIDIRNINLPNGNYWLAPERRQETFAFLSLHFISFAFVLVVFLAYVHWLVVQANQRQPPQLSTPAVLTGLVVFITAVVGWLIILFRRFRKIA